MATTLVYNKTTGRLSEEYDSELLNSVDDDVPF